MRSAGGVGSTSSLDKLSYVLTGLELNIDLIDSVSGFSDAEKLLKPILNMNGHNSTIALFGANVLYCRLIR